MQKDKTRTTKRSTIDWDAIRRQIEETNQKLAQGEVMDAAALEKAWAQRSRWQEMGEQARKFIAASYNEENSFADLLGVLKQEMN